MEPPRPPHVPDGNVSPPVLSSSFHSVPLAFLSARPPPPRHASGSRIEGGAARPLPTSPGKQRRRSRGRRPGAATGGPRNPDARLPVPDPGGPPAGRARGREGRGRVLLPGCLPRPLRKRSRGWRGRTRRLAGVPQESSALAGASPGGRGGHGHAGEGRRFRSTSSPARPERGWETWIVSHPLLSWSSVFPSSNLSQQRGC